MKKRNEKLDWCAILMKAQNARKPVEPAKSSITFSIGDEKSGEYAERKVFVVDVGDISSEKVKEYYADMHNEIIESRFDDAMEIIQ